MKKIIGLIALCLATTFTASPALAQTPAQPAAPTTQDPQCTPENKLAWYNEFRQNFKTDTAKANELAKKWLACPQVAGEEQITPYLKNFVALYEKAIRGAKVHELVYGKTPDYPKAIELAKAVLADEPENLKVLIDYSYAGYASKSPAYQADTLTHAKKAIQLIESGKTLENWTPYTNKEEALGYLYNAIGSLTVQKSPAEGLPILIKAAQYEGKLKKLPFTYGTIAEAYEAGPYAKMSTEYKEKFGGKDETPESKLALENINQIIDRMIDAYARAVALAGSDAQYANAKKAWMDSLTTWYKFRNPTQAEGSLDQMIAGILAKPLPPLPTPLTTLPATTPASTPTSGNSNAAGTNPASSSTTQPTTTTKPTTTDPAKPTTTEPAKPAPKPTPTPASKPRTRRNHRGR